MLQHPGGATVPAQTDGQKKPRGKSLEAKAFDATQDYSTIQVKLNSLMRSNDPATIQVRAAVFGVLNTVAFNASKASLEAGVLSIDHILGCFANHEPLPKLNQGFYDKLIRAVTDTPNEPPDSLKLTVDEYKREWRPRGLSVPTSKYMSLSWTILAKEMATNARNHIVLNFRSRLLRHLKVRFKLDREAANRFLEGAFSKDESTRTTEESALVKWLVYNPCYEENIERHLEHFLLLSSEILAWFEKPELKNVKGVRTFKLLPTKDSFVMSFTMIHKSTLPDLLQLLDVEMQKNIVRLMIPKCPNEEDKAFLTKRLHSRAVFCSVFHQNDAIVRALWSTLFEFKQFETVNRKFAYKISTNGCAVTVYMQKPKRDLLVGAPVVGGMEHIQDYDQLPLPEAKFDRIIGLDPGRKSLATTYWGEEYGDSDGNMRSVTTRVSTKEYRFDAKMPEHRAWNNRLRVSSPEYDVALKTLDTLKTQDRAKFRANAHVMLEQGEVLMDFCRRKAFRNWRFKLSRNKKKAISKAARKIVGPKGLKVCVGFGDWSETSSGFLKGSDPAPVKALRKELRTMATVIKVNEDCTSKVCSCCREKNLYQLRLAKQMKDGEVKCVPCHGVLRCGNNECAISWQRDVNASRNIHTLTVMMLSRLERPMIFHRATSRVKHS